MEEKVLSLDDAQSGLKPFIEPGIHSIEIIGREEPGIDVTGNREFNTLRFVTSDGSQELLIRFYYSRAQEQKQAAVTVSCKQLNHILENSVSKEEYAELKKQAVFEYSEEYEGWCNMYDWLMNTLIGKKMRMKFIGEMKAPDKVITRLGFPPFAENLNIPIEKSKLKFDPQNPRDLKPAPPDLLSPTGEADKLPI